MTLDYDWSAFEDSNDIAIISLSGRFPEADNVTQFWQNLTEGVECVTKFTDQDLLDAGVSPETLRDPNYVKAGAVLNGVDLFDASFFGLTPREAQSMDPQQRLFLEEAWKAIETAGYVPAKHDHSIGVFAGVGLSTYLMNNIAPNPAFVDAVGKMPIVLGNDKDSLTTRVAYLLDLTGPCVTVQTYCSTSLVAISTACENLLGGVCDMALAGGVFISIPQKAGYYYQEGGIASPDARCRAFDVKAKGAPLGNGVGVVLLKRLEDAVRDGDTIYAVIKGWAINNDGALRVGYTAPGVRGQAGVILEAITNADVPAESIQYIEAHGTGTALGDAVEFQAMNKAFSELTDKKEFCAIASVKTNVGHLDRAAGVTGVIKTALSLKHKLIPASLNYEEPNPAIDFKGTPFFVNTRLRDWQENGPWPRRAGVSSFGMGGTNAHVVLEECPQLPVDEGKRPYQLLLLSAKTKSALDVATTNLQLHLEGNPTQSIHDVAYTLQVGRQFFEQRRILVCQDVDDAVQGLSDPQRLTSFTTGEQNYPVTFMFAGVGEQYENIARDLYDTEPCFQQVVTECAEHLHSLLGVDIIQLLYSQEPVKPDNGKIDLRQLLGRHHEAVENTPLQQTEIAQPVMFVIEYGLAKLLQSWGIEPDSLIGYSLGEYVCACLAGVMSLKDALYLVTKRAQLIQQLETGRMLAVPLSAADVQPYLSHDLDLALINSPQTCVLAGTHEAVANAQKRLTEHGVACQLLNTTHAFHSYMMQPIAQAFTALVQSITLHPPEIPYISNVTGDWITPEQATTAAYWAQHLCQTVHFEAGIEKLLSDDLCILLEIGPGQSLGSFVKQNKNCQRDQWRLILPTLPHGQQAQSAAATLWQTLGHLWLNGQTISWERFYEDEYRRRIPLPTYPFEKQSYWIDPPKGYQLDQGQEKLHSKKSDPREWFYTPVWEEQEHIGETAVSPTPLTFLLFSDQTGYSPTIANLLQQQGHTVIQVTQGSEFSAINRQTYTLDPTNPYAYLQLLRQIAQQGQKPERVIHAWSITSSDTILSFDDSQKIGYYSLIYLAQALDSELDQAVQLVILSNDVQAIAQEARNPAKATLLGPARIIAQEYQAIQCQTIDIDNQTDARMILADIINVAAKETALAYRHNKRYRLTFTPHTLSPEPARLRQKGVYLITGGLGSVGLTIAEHLAETMQAQIILTSRHGLPDRDEWERHGPEDTALRKKFNAIRHIESLGAKVLVLAADVTDQAAMKRVFTTIAADYGTLHGVIHGAGLTDPASFQPLQMLERTVSDNHFLPKVQGTQALQAALKESALQPDFCLLLSSLSSILGGLGFTAYASANIFMDAFAHTMNRQQSATQWISVNWDTWQSEAAQAESNMRLGSSIAEFVMNREEGKQAFALAVNSQHSQLVNSTGDLQQRIQEWVYLEGVSQPQSANTTAVSRPQLDTRYVPASDEYAQQVAEIWQDVLGITQVGIHDNFFDLGGNSLIGLQLISKIQKRFKVHIPAVALFEAPTIDALVRYLHPETVQDEQDTSQAMLKKRRESARKNIDNQGIAIISMAGRFPGADNIETLWENLCDGVESISWFTDEELLASGVTPQTFNKENYVKARPIIDQADMFDAYFFGYSPREAELIDPQQRLFLECTWEALERAGYNPDGYKGLIGVFGGANLSTYMLRLAMDPQIVANVSDYQAVIGNDKDALATTVSYKLNLRGPSFAVQTFCSTSLVATHLACQSLLNGECDMALAGGVSVRVPQKTGYTFMEGGMESPDGHCRTFDAQAKGSLFGDGVAIVLLKRLEDALEDGDVIHAVIKGSAINNDGSLKVGYTAPSVHGQADVVEMAQTHAGIDPETIGYIEAHGTATELGDPIELASLTRAFRKKSDKKQYCAIGSIKTNMGHLDRAAGTTGLIKATLAVKHGLIPASLHYNTPNPEIDLANSPFYVNTKLSQWPHLGDGPRRAGVNSLGMGGTNAHVIIEQPPEQKSTTASRPVQLLLLSARTENALDTMGLNLAAYLQQHDTVSLADVAYTLQVGRKTFEQRRMLVCSSKEEAIVLLENQDPRHVYSLHQKPANRSIIFMFPGVGEHYLHMAQAFYEQEGVFRQAIKRCCEILHPYLNKKIEDFLYPPQTTAANGRLQGIDFRAMLGRGQAQQQLSDEERQLHETAVLQPIMFAIEYALAHLLMSWGIRPQGMVGYSLGEYVTACLSGVLSLEDALKLVAERARMIQASPRGCMLATSLSKEQVQIYLNQDVSLAAHNGQNMTVLAGSCEAVALLEKQLDEAEIACRRLPTSHAFHSNMMKNLADPLTELVQSITLHPPRIPYISNVTGNWITEEEATDTAYWAKHMCQPVQFYGALDTLFQKQDQIFLEIGPGQSLVSFAKQHPRCSSEQMPLILPIMRSRYDKQSDTTFMLNTIGRLWLLDVKLAWEQFYKEERRQRVELPTYPFERQRYWVDPNIASLGTQQASIAQARTPEEAISSVPRDVVDNWFYLPGWKQTAPLRAVKNEADNCWLLFIDEHNLGQTLADQLRAQQATVITVQPGEAYQQEELHFTVRPAMRADYDTMLRALRQDNHIPTQIVHLWTVSSLPTADLSTVDETLQLSLYSLIAFVQSFGEAVDKPGCISIVSTHVQSVTGQETICAEKATLIGPCRVIPLEYAAIQTRCVDVDWPATVGWQSKALVTNLIAELTSPIKDQMVALRGHTRWVEAFEPFYSEALPDNQPPALKEKGVYVITGGLGGIGLAMAAYLAKTVQAKLVLMGRSGLPIRAQWADIIEQGEDASLIDKLQKIQNLESMGAEVLTLAVDVSDTVGMATAVRDIIARFQTIDGVLHTAGVPGIGLTQLKTPETVANVIASKVQGTLVMEHVLQQANIQPDFMVLFSSITSITGGGPGQLDYCAGNAFLDAFARQRIGHPCQTISINWGEWQWNAWDSGLSGYHDEVQTFFRENRKRFGIHFDEGQISLGRVLASSLPQVVVSTQDFRIVAKLSQQFTAANILNRINEEKAARPRHARPSLGISYVAPRNDLEQKIVDTWGEILGLENVGIYDNFFDLGGNSLIGIDLIAQLRKQFDNKDIPAHILYEAPSVSALSDYFNESEKKVAMVEARQQRGEKRREQLAQMRQSHRRR